jgi:hypothetical protein
MDRETILAPLGLQRLRILDCLGGNEPRAPGYFDVQSGVDIFTAEPNCGHPPIDPHLLIN